eukprot:s2972_g2.t1
MFSIMNAPLGSLLGTRKETGTDLHPLVGLKKSMQNLGSASFMPGKTAGTAVPQFKPMEQLVNCGPAPQPGTYYYCQSCCQNRYPNANGFCSGCSQPFPGMQHLKDNSKFMVTDSLEVLESSTITALELLKEHVNDLKSIKTAVEKVMEESLKKLVVFSMLGAKDVLTKVFPGVASETECSSASDGSFEGVLA